MSETDARSEILAAVRAARPASVAAPDVAAWRREHVRPRGDVVARFVHAAASAGAEVAQVDDATETIQALASGRSRVLSAFDGVERTGNTPPDVEKLRDLELFICPASLGVAENGAVWIAPSMAAHRAALFLATHVVVVLDRATIVDTQHDAYDRIDIRAGAFGVFVAGPSKTADIEQSLVIGAHGPTGVSIVITRQVPH